VVRLGFGPDEIRFPWPFLSHEGGPAESPGQRGSVFHVRNHERKSQGTKKNGKCVVVETGELIWGWLLVVGCMPIFDNVAGGVPCRCHLGQDRQSGCATLIANNKLSCVGFVKKKKRKVRGC